MNYMSSKNMLMGFLMGTVVAILYTILFFVSGNGFVVLLGVFAGFSLGMIYGLAVAQPLGKS